MATDEGKGDEAANPASKMDQEADNVSVAVDPGPASDTSNDTQPDAVGEEQNLTQENEVAMATSPVVEKRASIDTGLPLISGAETDNGMEGTEKLDPGEIISEETDVASIAPDPVSVETHEHVDTLIPTTNAAVDLREVEEKMVGGEIMFLHNPVRGYNGWNNLRWMALSGVRKVLAFEHVYRYVEGQKSFLWNKKNEYISRQLAVYEKPNLILVLRRAEGISEFRELMELPTNAEVDERSLKTHLFVESVVDPKTAKLRLSSLTTISSILPDVPREAVRRRSCFELITPFETIILCAVKVRGGEGVITSFTDSGAFLETSRVEYALTTSICAAHEPNLEENYLKTSDLAWRHQVILGTLHSFVVLGNQKYLEMSLNEALQSQNARDEKNPTFLDPRLVDAMDESGKTPLHYACSSRFSSAVKSLVSAGADVNKRVQPGNLTPCHICANNLDFDSLQVIVSSNRRPNVIDHYGRSPMYLAISEGRTVGGQRNPGALERCITVLEQYGGEIDAIVGRRHPVSQLASLWQSEELEVVMKHCKYRYPLNHVNAEERGISIDALYQYPVHSALVTMRKRLQEAAQNVIVGSISSFDRDCIKTLGVLFSCGFEPNERIEGFVDNFSEREDLDAYIGYAPIQIVVAAFLDAAHGREAWGQDYFSWATKLTVNMMKFMVEHGARTSLQAPPCLRRDETDQILGKSSVEDIPFTASESESVSETKRSDLKIQSNKDLVKMLDAFGLSDAMKTWKEARPVVASPKSVFFTDKLAIENSSSPGGSDDKSCAICWKGFGMLVRKHRCRLSRRFVCDECSSQRVIANNGEEHRVSDGQYLLARAEVSSKQKVPTKQMARPNENMRYGCAAARLEKMEAEEQAQRDSLFGGIVSSVATALAGTAEAEEMSRTDSISGISSQLNQTREALNERGAKLNSLADKSDKLVSASHDFASMAKELNRKSNQGLFSW